MYDERVKRLRELASIPEHCEKVESCDRCSKEEICLSFTNKRIIEVATQAADAIEEQQAQIDGWIEQERNALLKSIPKWIPVTERLPKEEETVLAFGTLGVAWLDWRHDNKWCCYGGVTHWMPLPQPPKEE